MTRYFFHVRDGESFTEDQEGAEMLDLEAARVDAVRSATELVADCVSSGEVVGNQQFEISEAHGTVLAVIPFRSVIHLK